MSSEACVQLPATVNLAQAADVTIASTANRERHMGRFMVVAVLALLGYFIGAAVTALGPGSYEATDEFTLTHSRDAIGLAAVARSQHVQGVRVRVHDAHTFEVTGHGSLKGSVSALNAVYSQVKKAIKRMRLGHVWKIYGGVHALARPQGNATQTGVIGFLAGLGTGFGIVVFPWRRLSGRVGLVR
jgi:hypothetical protein